MAQAVERRLPAIYDALDSRNNKQALKLIHSALQKHSKSQVLRVLKAIALQRTGKDDEGLQVCEEIRHEVPTDETVLSTMAIVYRKANRLQSMSAAYAAASEACPWDEGLLRGVFTSHVRDFDFAGQQQVALKLHKMAGPKDSFYIWWAIVAIALQAKAAAKGRKSALPAEKLFQLAEVMIAKQAQKEGIQTYEQLMLFLNVLKSAGHLKTALGVLEDTGHVITMTAERRSLQASLLAEVGERQKAAALFREALLNSPDDWTCLQQYLECMLSTPPRQTPPDPSSVEEDSQLASAVSHSSLQDDTKDALDEAERTVHQLLDRVQSDPKLKADAARGFIRAPQLALVEIQLRRLHASDTHTHGQPIYEHQAAVNGQQEGKPEGQANGINGKTAKSEGQGTSDTQQRGHEQTLAAGDATHSLAEAVWSYYKQLGHMLSCAVDLRAYTTRIEGSSKAWLAQQLRDELQSLQAEADSAQKQRPSAAADLQSLTSLTRLRKQISAYQIQHDLSVPFASAADAEAHAVELFTLYKHSLSLCKGLDPKEKAPGDDLIPIAVASLMAARNLDQAELASSQDGGRTSMATERVVQKRMLQALLVAEAAQKRSTVVAEPRFACTALYGLLGAAAPAFVNFKALAIKHIQHDTITGHHMLPVSIGCQDPGSTEAMLTETILLQEDHTRDAGDTLMMAFDKGTFTKVVEFVNFKERLERSHALAVARSEQALSHIRQSVPQRVSNIQSALSKACQNLSQTSLLTQHSGLPRLEQLRFNEDLSTRPSWLPPQGCGVEASLLQWWEQQATAVDSGYGRCWWARPGAADLPDQAAHSYRQQCFHSLQARWLMPQVMLQLTTFETQLSEGADAAGAAANGSSSRPDTDQASALPQLSELFGVAYSDLETWLDSVSPSSPQLPQQWPPETQADAGQHHRPGVQQHSQLQAQQLISLAAFAAADAGKAYWQQCQQFGVADANTSSNLQAQASSFAKRLAAVQTAFSACCHHTIQQIQSQHEHMILGSSVLAAVHLVSEPATWLCLFITAWQHQFGSVKKKQGKRTKGDTKTEGSHADHPGQAVIQEQLVQTQQACAQSLQALVNALNARLKSPAKMQLASAMQAVLGDQQSALAQALAECMSQTEARGVLDAVSAAQGMTLKRIRSQATDLLSTL